MRLSHLLLLSIVLQIAFTGTSLGQVDPSWLRSWNLAQEQRPSELKSVARIADEEEPGIDLVIRGQVVKPDGTPASGVVIHAYHRDEEGLEFGRRDSALETWKLQGWAKSDSEGRFEFQTIRPSPDHLGREASHIHFTVESKEFGRQWAPKVFLSDDPLLTEKDRQRAKEPNARYPIVEVRTVLGVQHIDVRIPLKKTGDF